MKQNPFSLYDFLGYLIPGATLIYLFLIINSCGGNFGNYDLSEIVKSVTKYELQEVFFFVIVSYALGHIISFISSISVEKYGNWKYGYPSKTIIGYLKKSYWIQGKRPSDWEQDNFLYEIEDNKCQRKLRNFGRAFLILILLPLVVIEWILGTLLNFNNFYSKGLDTYSMKVIKKNALILLNSDGLTNCDAITENDLKTIDFNRIVHHYAFENSQHHQFRMVNYVALYGFLRNLVLTFVLSFWYFFIISLKTIDYKACLNWNIILINILIMCFSFVAFMAYMKFYRRYTLEGLMLIVVDKKVK